METIILLHTIFGILTSKCKPPPLSIINLYKEKLGMAKVEETINLMKSENTYRRYEEGDHKYDDFSKQIFNEDTSHQCPTYIHKTPPCQGSCPSGEDIWGWLQIVRGIEKAPEGMSMPEYAFRRSTTANPFPSQMGRVCPAPCQSGCNRNDVDDFVGINAVEQYIGD